MGIQEGDQGQRRMRDRAGVECACVRTCFGGGSETHDGPIAGVREVLAMEAGMV